MVHESNPISHDNLTQSSLGRLNVSNVLAHQVLGFVHLLELLSRRPKSKINVAVSLVSAFRVCGERLPANLLQGGSVWLGPAQLDRGRWRDLKMWYTGIVDDGERNGV